MNLNLLQYAATYARNREVFLLNYGNDFTTFNDKINSLHTVWSRIGVEKDLRGRFHARLLPFTIILFRHAILGFQHLVSYQSFAAWSIFRPGIEALLFLGNFVDMPENAKIWRNKSINFKSYQKSFSSKCLISNSLPRSVDFKNILTHLNNNFMHPNPDFTDRDISLHSKDTKLSMEIQFFDVSPDIHHGHLLAYLNLLDLILQSSLTLVNNLCGKPQNANDIYHSFAEVEEARATKLAKLSSNAKNIMEELGLWQFKSIL